MNVPSTTPCAKVATAEPPQKARSQKRRSARVLEAELESDAAEDEREQHDQDREIDRRNDDGEGERKRREQAQSAEYQPGLVAVPDRRDRIHHDGARGVVRREAVENADAEIEAVEDDVIEDRQREQDGPSGTRSRTIASSDQVRGRARGAFERSVRPAALDRRSRSSSRAAAGRGAQSRP